MDKSLAEFLISGGYEMYGGVFVNKAKSFADNDFEEAYLKARQNEGRLYDMATIQKLPHVPVNHPLANEWRIRQRTAEKFANYLSSKKTDLNVLEIGCGNGWLTHFLAQKLPESQFTGMDVNTVELYQAAEAFEDSKNISWLFEEITSEAVLPDGYFDIIFFAAAIQYFPDLKGLLTIVAKYLAPEGEIHILDSPFYTAKKAGEAQQRTKDYYSRLAPEMVNHYFHHTIKNLYESGFKVKKMNFTSPFSFLKKLDKIGLWDYFGWYCLIQ